MKIKPFNSIAGLQLYLQDDGGNDVVSMKIPRDSLSLLAIHSIYEIQMDASEDLIQVCRDLIEAVDKDKAETLGVPLGWRDLRPHIQDTLVELEMDNIRDSLKDCAHEELNKYDLNAIAEMVFCTESDDEPTKAEIEAWIEKAQLVEPDDDEMYEVLEALKIKGITFKSLADSDEESLIDIGDWIVAKGYVYSDGNVTPAGIDWMRQREEHYAQENDDGE